MHSHTETDPPVEEPEKYPSQYGFVIKGFSKTVVPMFHNCGQCSQCKTPSVYCPKGEMCIYASQSFCIQVCRLFCQLEGSLVLLKLSSSGSKDSILIPAEPSICPSSTITFDLPEGLESGWWSAQLCIQFTDQKDQVRNHKTCENTFFIKPNYVCETECEPTADCVEENKPPKEIEDCNNLDCDPDCL